jgi:hypothetical protein
LEEAVAAEQRKVVVVLEPQAAVMVVQVLEVVEALTQVAAVAVAVST